MARTCALGAQGRRFKSGRSDMVPEVTASNPPNKNNPDIQVNYRVGDQNFAVGLKDFKRLMDGIDSYNEQFSFGSVVARKIGSLIDRNDEMDENQTNSSMASFAIKEKSNQEFSEFLLTANNKKILESVGLSFDPISGKTTPIFTEEGGVSSGPMRMNVFDNTRFVAFLTALTQEQLDTSGIKPGMEQLIEVFAQQIYGSYNLLSPEPEALQLFAGLDDIIIQYKRLGMGKAVERIEDYNRHGKIGDLREHIAAIRFGLFNDLESFGPAKWQTDANAEQLEKRWNEALAVLEMAGKNPKAFDIYKKLQAHLSACIDVALQSYLETNFPQEAKEKQKTVLDAVKQKLEMEKNNSK